MEIEKFLKTLKYVPKISTALIHFLLLCIAMFLFFGRNIEAIRLEGILKIEPDFYSHISNFSIIFMLYTTAGYMGILMGTTVKHIAALGGILLLANLVIERWIPILNTPDPVDALYGVIGVVLGFILLYFAKKYGVKVNEL